MPAETHRPPNRRSKRLLWFIALYLASLMVFTMLVYGLRFIIPH